VDILKRGVEIVEHTKVDDLIIKDNIALGAKTKNKDYYANNTIVCGGPLRKCPVLIYRCSNCACLPTITSVLLAGRKPAQ
jgi:hypothetical protein